MLNEFTEVTAEEERIILATRLELLLNFIRSDSKTSNRIGEMLATVESLPKLWEEFELEFLRREMNSHVDFKKLERQLDLWLGDEAVTAQNILSQSWKVILHDSFLGPFLATLPKNATLFREIIKLTFSDLTQVEIGQILGLSQPAVRHRIAEAFCLLPFLIGLERLRDNLFQSTERDITYEFLPKCSSRRMKMPVKHTAVLVRFGQSEAANLLCLSPIGERESRFHDQRELGLAHRIAQSEESEQEVPLLIYQFSIDSLQLIFSEPNTFLGVYPNSLYPKSLENMKRRGVKVWASIWDWQKSTQLNGSCTG